ncbi:MAG: hypothetical protein HC836_41195 [Richelia sp. RM2_1_2]|nr:hypothetical protein [Richelia sp. RM2_1_2]
MNVTIVTDSISLPRYIKELIEDYIKALKQVEEEIEQKLKVLVYYKKEDNEGGKIEVRFENKVNLRDLYTLYGYLDSTFSTKTLLNFPNGLEFLENIKLSVLLEDTFIDDKSTYIMYYKADVFKEMKKVEYLKVKDKLQDEASFDVWFDNNLEELFVEAGTIIIESD